MTAHPLRKAVLSVMVPAYSRTQATQGGNALTTELNDRLDSLEAAIDRLRESIAGLADDLGVADEVRTRRLVVVDDTGFERVVAGTTDMEAYVEVFAKPRKPNVPAPTVALMVGEHPNGMTAGVIVHALEQNVVQLEALVDDNLAAEDGIAITDLRLRDVVNPPRCERPGSQVVENESVLSAAHLTLQGVRLGADG